MKFRNPQPPDGINVSRHNPLVDLLLLSLGVLLGFCVLAVVLLWLGGALARFVPVSWENALGDSLLASAKEEQTAEQQAIEAELQSLVNRLVPAMDLDPDQSITVHYLDEPVVNAAATIGGHIFVYRGLLQTLPSENALAMVLAHEIGHVKHRDAISRLGGLALLKLTLGVALGIGPGSLESLTSGAGSVINRGFSREAEEDADVAALEAQAALYGHLGDADRLFRYYLAREQKDLGGPPIEFLSTHPLSEDRVEAIAAWGAARGLASEGPLTPLTPAIAALQAPR